MDTPLSISMESLTQVLRTLHDPAAPNPGPWWAPAMNGHCDAFACALQDWLAARGVSSELVLISRERFDENNESVEYVAFSHVVLRALGETWDIEGPRALERRSEDWEPTAGYQDEFYDETLSRCQLDAARREERSGQGVSQERVAVFAQAIAEAAAVFKPSVSSMPGRRRR